MRRLGTLAVVATTIVAGTLLPLPPVAVGGEASAGRVLVSPPELFASVAPGQSSNATILVANQSRSPATVTIETGDLAPDPDGARFSVLVDEGEAPRGAGEWLQPATSIVRLRPRERRTIPVAIRVPSDASGGGHYGAIIVTTTDSGGSDDASDDAVRVRLRLVTNVIVNVPGMIDYGGSIRRLQVERADDGDLLVRGEYRNDGDLQSDPTDERMRAETRTGSASSRVEIRRTMPGGIRSFRGRIGRPAFVGRARVQVSATLEDGTRIRSRTVEVWTWHPLAPWLGGLLPLALVGLVGVLVWHRRRRRFQLLVDEELARMELEIDDEPPADPTDDEHPEGPAAY